MGTPKLSSGARAIPGWVTHWEVAQSVMAVETSTWIMDSGASRYVYNILQGLADHRKLSKGEIVLRVDVPPVELQLPERKYFPLTPSAEIPPAELQLPWPKFACPSVARRAPLCIRRKSALA
ncbi:hypothetical protein L3X38_004488 [Prunus dulcis]|uniref:Uncharacterized protein n=1 Tax=Prunus dulcis TaxID=3755 RepID=A0AAD4ZP31_PRUDU|nr:hypothetical protein L3X38_004488 [Prunus dulcis]